MNACGAALGPHFAEGPPTGAVGSAADSTGQELGRGGGLYGARVGPSPRTAWRQHPPPGQVCRAVPITIRNQPEPGFLLLCASRMIKLQEKKSKAGVFQSVNALNIVSECSHLITPSKKTSGSVLKQPSWALDGRVGGGRCMF